VRAGHDIANSRYDPVNKSIVVTNRCTTLDTTNITNTPSHHNTCLRILSWNIDGNTALKMSCPSFISKITQFHIVFLQETHLATGEHEALIIPKGWTAINHARVYTQAYRRQFGGILALIRDGTNVTLRKEFWSPDIMVIEIERLLIVNAYILPEHSDWSSFTQVEPFLKLRESVMTLAQLNKPILLLGDLNARTAELGPHDTVRKSADAERPSSSRGRSLIALCEDANMTMLNGISSFGPNNAGFTSHQPRGSAVVDYAIMSIEHLPMIKRFEILAQDISTSDHSALAVFTNLPVTLDSHATEVICRKKVRVSLPQDTELDRMFIETLNTKITDEMIMMEIYGGVIADTPPTEVYIHALGYPSDSVGTHSATVVGVYWGTGNLHNMAFKFTGKQSAERGELLALYEVLCTVRPGKSVRIYTTEKALWNSLIRDLRINVKQHWKVSNGDILETIANILKQRVAPLIITQIEHDVKNTILRKIKEMAAHAIADKPKAVTLTSKIKWPEQQHTYTGDYILLDIAKVHGTVLADLETLDKNTPRHKHIMDEDLETNMTVKRARTQIYAKQKAMREKLLNAPTMAERWKTIRNILGQKDIPTDFSPDDLRKTFEVRMNPIVPPPPSFDINKLLLDKLIAATIPERTTDSTPEQYFSRAITAEEIQFAKAHLAKKSANSARGWDQISYQDLMDTENEALANLFNKCLENNDAPSAWLKTIVVGIVKRGKPKDIPESYRAVGLESCTLKLLTLLIHQRMTDWMEAYKILPETQNAFRKGYRTNNNAFILQCAIKKARALGKTLYVVFADLSNAFPSTEQSTLWVKLRQKGAGGKMFDWLRMLYRCMSYVVQHNGEMSEAFQSLIGILIGDSASPTLWNFYFADFVLPNDPDDIPMWDIMLGNMEQADDMLLLSMASQALQCKMDALHKWCRKNFMVLNAAKSYIMIFGPTPRGLPKFMLGNDEVSIVQEHTYVGVTFRSSLGNIFKTHYENKASKARQIGGLIFGMESSIGLLPPEEGIALYTALLDPHLTHGAEISPDVNKSNLAPLQEIQHGFIRRLLGLPKNSSIVVLFTETGLTPLKFRRLLASLVYLKYLVELPADRLAHKALRDSIYLDRNGHQSWITDIRKVIESMELGIDFPDLSEINSVIVTTLIRSIREAMKNKIQQELENTSKLYLLHGRLEHYPEGKGPKQITLLLRHYLKIPHADHRKSLTRLILSCHQLALEKLRHTEHRRPKIPRDRRICRFCKCAVESPEHALLECEANLEINALRTVFTEKLAEEVPDWGLIQALNPLSKLRILINNRDITGLLGKFTHEVLRIFDDTPILVPATPLDWLISLPRSSTGGAGMVS
jgi:exonuclease III